MPSFFDPDTLGTLNLVATSLPSLPAVSGFLHRIAGLNGSPSENWAVIGAGVALPWVSGKVARAYEMIGDIWAAVEELRDARGGRAIGGGSFARLAEGRAADGNIRGTRAAYVMVGGAEGYPVRVVFVSRPVRMKRVAGRGMKRAG